MSIWQVAMNRAVRRAVLIRRPTRVSRQLPGLLFLDCPALFTRALTWIRNRRAPVNAIAVLRLGHMLKVMSHLLFAPNHERPLAGRCPGFTPHTVHHPHSITRYNPHHGQGDLTFVPISRIGTCLNQCPLLHLTSCHPDLSPAFSRRVYVITEPCAGALAGSALLARTRSLLPTSN